MTQSLDSYLEDDQDEYVVALLGEQSSRDVAMNIEGTEPVIWDRGEFESWGVGAPIGSIGAERLRASRLIINEVPADSVSHPHETE